jgi:hypothetical protein
MRRYPSAHLPQEAILDEYREAGLHRAVLVIPDSTRDEILKALDNYARLVH